MIAGLPVATWLLIIAAVGVGLVIEIAFLRAHARERRGHSAPHDARSAPLADDRRDDT